MSNSTLSAEKKLNRADKMLKYSIVIFFIYMVAALTLLIYQGFVNQANDTARDKAAQAARDEDTKNARDRLNEALKENARQHTITQQKIQCVAKVLLTPISERRDSDFEACGIPDLKQTSVNRSRTNNNAKTNETPSSQAVLPAQPKNPSPQQPVPTGNGGDEPDRTAAALTDIQSCVLFGIICSTIKAGK